MLLRNWSLIRYLALVFTVASPSVGQAMSPRSPVGVCDILRNPNAFNETAISIRGIYTTWEHGLWLTEMGCDDVMSSLGFMPPAGIAIVLREDLYQQRELDIADLTRTLEELGERVSQMVTARGGDATVSRITVTFAGVFETHDDLASRPGDGFGALNAAPGQLYVKGLENVEIEFEDGTSSTGPSREQEQ